MRTSQAVEEDLAVGGLDQAGEHFDGGALARAVGAQIAEDLAGADDEADIVHHPDAVVSLHQIPHFQHGVLVYPQSEPK